MMDTDRSHSAEPVPMPDAVRSRSVVAESGMEEQKKSRVKTKDKGRTAKEKRSLLVSLAILFVLIGLFAIVTATEARNDQRIVPVETIIPFTADEIAEITFDAADGTTITLARESGKWVLRDLIGTPAYWRSLPVMPDMGTFSVDQDKAALFAVSLTGIPVNRVISDVTNLSEYGLSTDGMTHRVMLHVTDYRGTTCSLRISEINEDAGVVYVLSGEDATTVYVCGTALRTNLLKTLEDFAPV